MGKLQIEVIRKFMNMALLIKSNLTVLKQLFAHCFIYRCHKCFKQ